MKRPRPLYRLRLRRRWGKRSTWTGNDVRDVTVRQVSDDHWYAEGWMHCRCGREFHVYAGAPAEDEVRICVRINDGLCRTCKAWVHRCLGQCPDGNCTLGYWHRGRCKPLEIPDEWRRRARQEQVS